MATKPVQPADWYTPPYFYGNNAIMGNHASDFGRTNLDFLYTFSSEMLKFVPKTLIADFMGHIPASDPAEDDPTTVQEEIATKYASNLGLTTDDYLQWQLDTNVAGNPKGQYAWTVQKDDFNFYAGMANFGNKYQGNKPVSSSVNWTSFGIDEDLDGIDDSYTEESSADSSSSPETTAMPLDVVVKRYYRMNGMGDANVVDYSEYFNTAVTTVEALQDSSSMTTTISEEVEDAQYLSAEEDDAGLKANFWEYAVEYFQDNGSAFDGSTWDTSLINMTGTQAFHLLLTMLESYRRYTDAMTDFFGPHNAVYYAQQIDANNSDINYTIDSTNGSGSDQALIYRYDNRIDTISENTGAFNARAMDGFLQTQSYMTSAIEYFFTDNHSYSTSDPLETQAVVAFRMLIEQLVGDYFTSGGTYESAISSAFGTITASAIESTLGLSTNITNGLAQSDYSDYEDVVDDPDEFRSKLNTLSNTLDNLDSSALTAAYNSLIGRGLLAGQILKRDPLGDYQSTIEGWIDAFDDIEDGEGDEADIDASIALAVTALSADSDFESTLDDINQILLDIRGNWDLTQTNNIGVALLDEFLARGDGDSDSNGEYDFAGKIQGSRYAGPTGDPDYNGFRAYGHGWDVTPGAYNSELYDSETYNEKRFSTAYQYAGISNYYMHNTNKYLNTQDDSDYDISGTGIPAVAALGNYNAPFHYFYTLENFYRFHEVWSDMVGLLNKANDVSYDRKYTDYKDDLADEKLDESMHKQKLNQAHSARKKRKASSKKTSGSKLAKAVKKSQARVQKASSARKSSSSASSSASSSRKSSKSSKSAKSKRRT